MTLVCYLNHNGRWVRDDVIIFKMEDKNIWNLLDLKETHLNTSPGNIEWSTKLFRKSI